MKNYNLTSETNTRLSFTSVFRFALIGMVSLFLSMNTNAQTHADMQMVFVGSTDTTADFDVVLTNDGTTALNFNAIVMRANNATVSTITTSGSTITVIALNNNTIPAWTNSNGTWPAITGNLSYFQTGGSFKLNHSTESTFFNSTNRPSLPANTPVNIGRFRFVVTGGTWIPNSQLGFSWFSNAGIVCSINGAPLDPVTSNLNTPSTISTGVSANQPLNVPTAGPNIAATDCGSTFNYLFYEYINAVPVVGATEYEFRISDLSGVIDTFNSGAIDSIRFSDFVGYAYNSTYSVDVRAKVAGVWSSFGSACNISMGAPTASILSQCGTTLGDITENIFATSVPLVNNYRFEVSQGGSVVGVIDRPFRFFSLSLLPGGPSYGTTYSIRVALFYNGVYTPYGSACSVTTPSLQTTQLTPAYCGVTLTTLSTNIFAVPITGATQYTFRLTNGANVQTFVSNIYLTSLNNFTLTYGTTYNVDVAVTMGGILGAYGSICTLTTPSLPTSQLTATYCGATLTTMSTNIFAVPITGATQYTFRVTNGANVQTHTSNIYLTSLNNFALTYGTTYNVDVAVTVGGVLGAYGTVCSLATPSLPTSQLTAAYFGATLTTMSTNIFAVPVTGATQYTFRVTNGANVQTYVSNIYLTSLNNFTLAYGTTYNVDVAVTIAGLLGAYGSVCTLTTPSSTTITTSMRANNCGITTSNLTQNIFSNGATGATHYKFRLTNGANVQEVETTNYFIGLFNYVLTNGTTYDVDISVKINGVYGVYGPVCTITTPEIATIAANDKPTIVYNDKSLNQKASIFDTKAYPNPYNTIIRLELTSDDATSPVSIKVFDATGRMIETRDVNLNNETSIDLGLDYESGVYQVHVIQNDNSDIVRIVKN
jgi:hypothetical protein